MRRFFSLLSVGALLGCNPTYAPPIRGLHAGMPDRVAKGQLEVGGAAGGWSLPTTGGPHVAYGYDDHVVLEAGANLNFVEGHWATGWAGVRLVRSRPLGHELHLVGDLELGAGAGLGGRLRGETRPWTSLGAYGLYEGLGFGLRWRWLGAFLRGRLDATASSDAPSTLWPSVTLGLEAKAGPHFVFALAGSRGGYWNQADGVVGIWLYEAQASFLFDLVPVTSAP